MKELKDIGFYTLSNERAKNADETTPMWRCEILLTDSCNFKCPYCRGLREDCAGTLSLEKVKQIIDYWFPIKNIRFSGGEPTVYPYLGEAIAYAKHKGIERIAISTNGSADFEYYQKLIDLGVNDFSISLDACCSAFGKEMCGGIDGAWEKVVENIRKISALTYVTLGMVFTEETLDTVVDVVKFGSELGAADIRIISSAQSNEFLPYLKEIPQYILDKHPILRYRVNHYLNKRNVRGIKEADCHKCGLILDDSAIAGNQHFPCIIYLREGGDAIGDIGTNMRKERLEWFKNHNSFEDKICRNNCLDVCIDYNNKYGEYHETTE